MTGTVLLCIGLFPLEHMGRPSHAGRGQLGRLQEGLDLLAESPSLCSWTGSKEVLPVRGGSVYQGRGTQDVALGKCEAVPYGQSIARRQEISQK